MADTPPSLPPSSDPWANPTDTNLDQRVGYIESLLGILSPRNNAGISTNQLLALTTQNWGDGSDGVVTLTANTSLSRDMFYDQLIINSGVTLSPSGYRIFAKTSIINNGTIDYSGTNGTAGSGVNHGNGGTLAGGSLPAAASGGNGGNQLNSGVNGASAPSIGNGGSGGGNGGSGGVFGGGGGGTGGNATATLNNPRTFMGAYLLFDPNGTAISRHAPAGGAGGGGGGGTGSTGQGGGGGGGGSSGGFISIFAKSIVNSGKISTNGGNGGKGADAPQVGDNGGGGGGGAGGNGGVMILVYGTLSGSGILSVAGGTPGAGGGGFGGTNGGAGTAGAAGVVLKVQVTG